MADSTELFERWNSAEDRTALEELLQRDVRLLAERLGARGGPCGQARDARRASLALNLLNSDDRDTLKSDYLGEREVAQIAREMGLTYDTTQKRRSRARLRLAQKLRRWSDLVDARSE